MLSDIYAVSLQSNAEMFAAGSLSGFAHLVNVETGRELPTRWSHCCGDGFVLLSSTSNMVVTSSNDTTVLFNIFQQKSRLFFSHIKYCSGTSLGCSQVRVYRKYHMLRRLRLCLLVEIIS